MIYYLVFANVLLRLSTTASPWLLGHSCLLSFWPCFQGDVGLIKRVCKCSLFIDFEKNLNRIGLILLKVFGGLTYIFLLSNGMVYICLLGLFDLWNDWNPFYFLVLFFYMDKEYIIESGVLKYFTIIVISFLIILPSDLSIFI